MKKIALFVLTAIAFISCNNLKENEFLITGTVNGIENGKKVYVDIFDEYGPISRDTSVVENGKFELKGTTNSTDLGFIRFEDQNFNVPLILEAGKINITVQKDSIHKSTIGGTKNNEIFQKFNNSSSEISKKVVKFEKDNIAQMKEAKSKNDTATVNKLMKQYSVFQDEMNKHSEKFIKENPNTFLSVLLLENFLMRNYLTKEKVTEYFNKLDKSIQETNSGKRISTIIFKKNEIKIGNKAPNFAANSPEGKKVYLRESLGKVTIIDFWASWCGPCRAENPNVVALYNEFHGQGLNIIGVSLDKDATKWKDAITKDGLTWPQISNLKHWDEPIAKLYNVESIPATFILDEKGIIVAKDLRGDALRAKVKELLGVK